MSHSEKPNHSFADRHSRSAVPALILLALTAAPALAQDWQFGPRVRLGGEFDDNAQLTARTDDIIELTGFLAQGRLDIGYSSDTTRFIISPQVTSRNYSDDPEFDSTDTFARFRFLYESPISTWDVTGRFSQESVRTAERVDDDLDAADPDDLGEGDSALVQLSGDRTRFEIRPRWDRQWSDVSSTRLEVRFKSSNYEDVFAGIFDDNTDSRFSASYRRKFSDRTTGVLTGAYRRFDRDDPTRDADFDGISVTAGVDTRLSETTRIRARIGIEDEERADGQSDNDYVADLTLIRRLQTIRMFAQYRRNISSSGTGILSARDSINVNFTRELSQAFDAGLGIRAYRTEPLEIDDPLTDFNERDFIQLNARFTWNVSRAFAIETNYRYTFLNRSIVGESADSNQVVLWFVYAPNPIEDAY